MRRGKKGRGKHRLPSLTGRLSALGSLANLEPMIDDTPPERDGPPPPTDVEHRVTAPTPQPGAASLRDPVFEEAEVVIVRRDLPSTDGGRTRGRLADRLTGTTLPPLPAVAQASAPAASVIDEASVVIVHRPPSPAEGPPPGRR